MKKILSPGSKKNNLGPTILYRFNRLFTSRITGRRELNQYAIRHASQGSVNTTENDDKSAKKNLCVCRLVCEQFFSPVTHHIEL